MNFSILLPCRNEANVLETQLSAILPQLEQGDQIVALDDGSTDDTQLVFRNILRPQDVLLTAPNGSGVCGAYNTCGAAASKDIILGQSGNDVMQPGTLARARQVFALWPNAKVAFGTIKGWSRVIDGVSDRFVTPDQLPLVWQQSRGFLTHGASAFMRREVWGEGYLPQLRWMADWYQTLLIAMRHGCIWMDHVCSQVNFSRDSFSAQHADTEKYNAVVEEMVKDFGRPCYDDIRPLGEQFNRICGWLRPRGAGGWGPKSPMKEWKLPGRLASPEEVKAMGG